ncbi:MAG: precorrin-6X reductase [Faecalibacterium sp. CAG:82-related_59_9]|nr:MAG: precorrin-6X reductase [Faecalibacterium sp. CAG:82-related_59_9]
MRAVVFSGTTEGRAFSKQLGALGADVLVSVATDLGAEEQGSAPGVTVRAGRLEPEEMTALLQGADLCIDATHPYAVEATKNIRAAGGRGGGGNKHPPPGPPPPPGGGILLTTGAKELGAFSPIAPERCYPRVLPTQEGIAACEAAGVPHRNIIAMQGPFSRALNEALIQQFEIRWLVTKDGGAAGGFAEKVQAAQSTGAQLVVLRRPPEQGQTAQEILNLCKEKML